MPDSILPFSRPCVKCGAADRYKSGDCKPCAAARAAANYAANRDGRIASVAAYRAANPEKVKEAQATYRAINQPKIKARGVEYRAANKDKAKAYQAKYYESNRGSLLAASAAYKAAKPEVQIEYRNARKQELRVQLAAWRLANPEKLAASAAAWAKANPEARRINQNNRRAKTKAGGVLSRGLSAKLFKLQKGRCACCKQPLGDDYHLDHIMPLALGGTNTDDNIQLLRQRCNSQKHAKHPVVFMQERGFLL